MTTELDKHLEQAFTYGMSAMKGGKAVPPSDFWDMARIPVRPLHNKAPLYGHSGLTEQNIAKQNAIMELIRAAQGRIPPEIEKQIKRVETMLENAISSRDNHQLPSHNMAMIHADIYGTAERRYRPCQNCHEDFRYNSEDSWLCPVCRGLRKEMERRQVVEGGLLDANKVLK